MKAKRVSFSGGRGFRKAPAHPATTREDRDSARWCREGGIDARDACQLPERMSYCPPGRCQSPAGKEEAGKSGSRPGCSRLHPVADMVPLAAIASYLVSRARIAEGQLLLLWAVKVQGARQGLVVREQHRAAAS